MHAEKVCNSFARHYKSPIQKHMMLFIFFITTEECYCWQRDFATEWHCLWAFSRIGKQHGRGPEVDSRKGTPLHVGLWKAVICETGKKLRGDLVKTTVIRMSKTMPISSQNTRNRRCNRRECSFKFRTDRRKYCIGNVGIYYKGGYARGRYILIQTMDSKKFYVKKNLNGC